MSTESERDTHTPVTPSPSSVTNERLGIIKSNTSISNTKKKRKLSSSSISNSSNQCTGMGDVSVSIERNDIDDIFGDV